MPNRLPFAISVDFSILFSVRLSVFVLCRQMKCKCLCVPKQNWIFQILIPLFDFFWFEFRLRFTNRMIIMLLLRIKYVSIFRYISIFIILWFNFMVDSTQINLAFRFDVSLQLTDRRAQLSILHTHTCHWWNPFIHGMSCCFAVVTENVSCARSQAQTHALFTEFNVSFNEMKINRNFVSRRSCLRSYIPIALSTYNLKWGLRITNVKSFE